jgi:hypothetical protein
VPVPTLSVSVELAPEVIGFGLKEVVVPAGRPLALSVTLCADPAVTAVEIVDVALPPCAAERLLGLAPIEKSEATPQLGSRKIPIRVRQLNVPLDGMYSFVYQKVQPSTGSTVIAL